MQKNHQTYTFHHLHMGDLVKQNLAPTRVQQMANKKQDSALLRLQRLGVVWGSVVPSQL